LKGVVLTESSINSHMAYKIPSRRVVVDDFPALCSSKKTQPVLDFTQLSFEEEVVPVQEKRVEPGWIRLSFQNGKVRMETDYVVPEKSVNELMRQEIVRMKTRWVKYYTNQGMEPYNYDYEPYEPEDEYVSEEESSVGEDPDDYESE
jgi:hypothetical protein